MLQSIKKIFSSGKKVKKSPSTSSGLKKGGDNWAEKQIKEMGKLRGKLILM